MSEKNVQRGPSSIPERTTQGKYQPTREAARAAVDRGEETAPGASDDSQRRWEDDGGELPCRLEAEHEKAD